MKRLIVALLLVLAIAITANASCVIKRDTPAYTDIETLKAVYRVWNLSGTSPRAMKMVKDAHEKGILIVTPGNTPIDKVHRITDYLSRITIRGTQVFIMNESMECN